MTFSELNLNYAKFRKKKTTKRNKREPIIYLQTFNFSLSDIPFMSLF